MEEQRRLVAALEQLDSPAVPSSVRFDAELRAALLREFAVAPIHNETHRLDELSILSEQLQPRDRDRDREDRGRAHDQPAT